MKIGVRILENLILEMQGITKTFPGVKALDDVNLQIRNGEIHALCGENGAGKSTLMNVLSGVYKYGSYQGAIIYEGKECKFKSVIDSENLGIAIIHQELALIPYLSIAENVFLGNEQVKNNRIDWNMTHKKAKMLLEKVGLLKETNLQIKDISVGEQQLVEIAKALSKKVKLLILDEPTAALNEIEANNLLKLLVQLKSEGITCIMISHKLNEIEAIADRITIIRDGKVIETLDKDIHGIAEEKIIKGMVGREIVDFYPKRENAIGDIAFDVKNWSAYDELNTGNQRIFDVSINVRKGEVIGIAGLMGAGRTEFAMSLFGKSYGKKITGKVYKNGRLIDISSVSKAIKEKVAYVTEDRKGSGLVLIDTIQNNITLTDLNRLSKFGVLNKNREHIVSLEKRKSLNIKCTSVYQKAVNLSGGNQQKVVLSKWIQIQPDILILDEPTRGIDVGAKFEIYTIINTLVAQGMSIVLISSEMPEVLGMSDRVYVMNKGRICGEFDAKELSQEDVMRCILKSNGGKSNEKS